MSFMDSLAHAALAKVNAKSLKSIATSLERLTVVAEAQLAFERLRQGRTPTEEDTIPDDEATEVCVCVSRWGRASAHCRECAGTGRVPEQWLSAASDAESAEHERQDHPR